MEIENKISSSLSVIIALVFLIGVVPLVKHKYKGYMEKKKFVEVKKENDDWFLSHGFKQNIIR